MMDSQRIIPIQQPNLQASSSSDRISQEIDEQSSEIGHIKLINQSNSSHRH